MSTKLKGLKVKKVDFVDQGANQDANIMLFKRKDGAPEQEVPENQPEAPKQNVWHKMFGAIAKAAGLKQEEADRMVSMIEKSGAESFGSMMNRRKNEEITDEIWDCCYALHSSLCSIMWDEELDNMAATQAMSESLDQFLATVKESASEWISGRTTGISKTTESMTQEEWELMKRAKDRLEDVLKEAPENKDDEEETPKGDNEEMKIDKSKMTPAERAFYEDIEKRYGAEESAAGGEATPDQPAAVPASQTPAATTPTAEDAVAKALNTLGLGNTAEDAGTDDIYKGLNPVLKAKVEELLKFKQDTEDKELHEVAKRYEIIGKKEDELFPVLKQLKAAGGTAYDDVIAVLNQTKETVEKSGVFGEVGKSGHAPGNAGTPGNAWATAETRAVELMKSKAGITKAQALDQVFQSDPELAKKCEEEE